MMNENSGCFIGLKGEHCKFVNISGVKELKDINNNDIIKIIHQLNNTIKILENRINALEKNDNLQLAELEKNDNLQIAEIIEEEL